MTTRECFKCRGPMEEGFVLDKAYYYAESPEWMSGKPEKSWIQGIKTKNRKRHAVTTWRCTKCGFLEAYAE